MQDFKRNHDSKTYCPKCKLKEGTETGTHGGCEKCGKVKHTANGHSNAWHKDRQ